MHGKLSDKVNITIEKGTLDSQFDLLIHLMLEARAKQRSLPTDAIDVALLQPGLEQPKEDDSQVVPPLPGKQPS